MTAAAVLVLVVGSIAAVAALGRREAKAPPSAERMGKPARPAGRLAESLPALESVAAASLQPGSVDQAALTAELDLLRPARTAYSRHDFSGALLLVTEHARRFPQGHLSEEREALRVWSLSGAGRPAEARRAAAAFAVRFPRSVLLSRVAQGSDAAD